MTDLTETGRRQASKVAESLKDEVVDMIFVSDLPRTMQTADPIISSHHGAQVIQDPRLRERYLGVFEGSPSGTVAKEAVRLGISYDVFVPENGESRSDLKRRVRAVVDDILLLKDKTLLVVSHGGPITHMLMYLLKFDDTPEEFERHHPKNAAITIIEIDDDLVTLKVLNSTSHLEFA